VYVPKYFLFGFVTMQDLLPPCSRGVPI